MSATTAQPTYEDVLRMFTQTDHQMKETDRKMQETARQMKETDRKMQETDREIQETARIVRENGQQMREMDERLNKKIGALGNRLGDFVQEMVRPAVVGLFQTRGIAVHEVYPNMSVNRNGGMEIDLFVVDDSQAIAIECKSHASTDDVKEYIEKLAKFKDFFPRYRDLELMGAIAAMVMPDNVAKYAYRQGLYVLAQSGRMVTVRNDDAFVPRFW